MPVANAVSTSLSIQSFTSSEPGAWSNSYLISGSTEAILFDVFMLHSDAMQIADGIMKSGKTLRTVIISHAHPDHFMGLDVITERFPKAQVVSTQNVVTDIKTDGPWMFSMLQGKLGPEGPTQLVIPKALAEPVLTLDGVKLEVVEFGEGESKHIAAVYIPELKALLSADLVYNQAHLYLQEKHLDSWLVRLNELEEFTKERVTTIHPGHGKAAGLELIEQTRSYLHDFADAVKSGDAKTAERRMLGKYPNYHVKQFLTTFSIPAYSLPPERRGGKKSHRDSYPARTRVTRRDARLFQGQGRRNGEAAMDYRAAKGLPRTVVYTASKRPRPLMFATPPTMIGSPRY
jgi:glyoxylase-like metal-dependent hydrolase (beta-lactamase superfamily II)